MLKTVLLAVCLFALPYQTTDLLQNIQRKYQDINAKLRSYSHIRKNEDGISAEGAGIDAYSDASGFKMIVEAVFAELSQTRTELYFDQGNLMLVYQRDVHYAVPMYDSTFNMKDSKITTSRFYFDQRKLIKWEGPKAKDSTTRQYRDQQASWLDYADDLVKQMKKQQAKEPLNLKK